MLSMLLTAALATIVTSAPTPATQSYSDAYRTAQQQDKPLLVVVSSDGCPACQTLKASTLEAMQFSGELSDVSVAVVDRDAEPQLASQLMRGRMIPQIIVFSQTDSGWKRFQLTGFQTQGGVRSLIRRALTRGRRSS